MDHGRMDMRLRPVALRKHATLEDHVELAEMTTAECDCLVDRVAVVLDELVAKPRASHRHPDRGRPGIRVPAVEVLAGAEVVEGRRPDLNVLLD